ncbi:MAG TPA: YhjD/YihY/BrkB family envelope integrity protein [Acidobacteriota bacterium]|jgi:membrane protein
MPDYKEIHGLIRETISGWISDHAPRTGAALAFYTVFSLAPILIISIAIAGAVFGENAARGEIVEQVRGLIH